MSRQDSLLAPLQAGHAAVVHVRSIQARHVYHFVNYPSGELSRTSPHGKVESILVRRSALASCTSFGRGHRTVRSFFYRPEALNAGGWSGRMTDSLRTLLP